jgi:hypothetical protein
MPGTWTNAGGLSDIRAFGEAGEHTACGIDDDKDNFDEAGEHTVVGTVDP